ncbi:MAG TPA: efflux RND transporter permease subunit [Kiritimatiellia bacterium]|jgi:HAE1 family hydrophobic/amphiphilic exporter-1|nr:efflux RND transporter permease subunit [Kiritimatiellia bacterium]HPK37247.1 efflux RND transporter permease subunit [Kiritimatiellia bacterium]HPW75396.1 efflux RND transporter permease subunit [Kiritimatiellia bacterium]HRU19464.1 efflux RND transporter permease subunit [Kiritimatiellia bacterium]
MRLPELGVKRPIFTLMVFIAILVLGGVSLVYLPVDLFPEIETPSVTVITQWPGASVEDVEGRVTRVIENQLSIVNNLNEVTSRTREGVSAITCMFEWGTDLEEAANDIRDRVSISRRFLPDDIEEPIIYKFNSSSMPVLTFAATAQESWEKLFDIIEDDLGDALKRLPGVGAVNVYGGLHRQINIDIDPMKLAGYNLTLAEIEETIARENLTLPAGSIKSGVIEYTVRVPGEFEDPEEARNIVVKRNASGGAIYLRDVADVYDGFEEPTRLSGADGKQSVIFAVQKRSGANTLKVCDSVLQAVEEYARFLPQDIRIVNVMNSSDFIRQSLSNVTGTLLWGGLFVTLTTFVFLRTFRASLVIVLTIPFSLIIAFFFMFIRGWTLNIISLSSLSVAIGMVVDNAVVVLENIDSYTRRGVKLREASMYATGEVGLAISASTLTTVAVFVPLIFVTGMAGIFFGQLGGIITTTLMASLFCSLMLTPMLATYLLKEDRDAIGGGWLGRTLYRLSEAGLQAIEEAYTRLLGRALRWRGVICALAFAVFCFSLALFPLIGSEFSPDTDSGDLTVNFELGLGTRVEETARLCEEVRQLGLDLIGAEHVVNSRWRCGDSKFGSGRQGSHIGRVEFKLTPMDRRPFNVRDAGRLLLDTLRARPEFVKTSMSTVNRQMGRFSGSGQPIVIEILGHDLAQTRRVAEEIKKLCDRTPGARDASVSMDDGKPELLVKVDRLKVSTLGLNVSDVVETIRTLFYGKEASDFREGENEYWFFLRLKESHRRELANILDSEIALPNGRRVRVDAIADVVQDLGPLDIERKDQERMVKVEVDYHERSIGEVVASIREGIAKEIVLPEATRITYGGMVKEQTEAFADLIGLTILGLVLVYMVMAAQFESLVDPLVIFLALPFAFSGVLFGLYGFGMTFNMFSFIGIILLVGTGVNNGIVLVDHINILRARGEGLTDAICHSGRQRLRPVLITTLTTVFGMLPLALAGGEGSETWKPMGVTVIGGLSFSTIVTLVLVPVLYSLFNRDARNPKTQRKDPR